MIQRGASLMPGALNADDCPRTRCKCGRCAICGHQMHVAIHCGVIGDPVRPYGHAFVLERKVNLAPVDLRAENTRLHDAVAWAYQALGALWPNQEALDNLSAVQRGHAPPHDWPVVEVEKARAAIRKARGE